jgi:WD40 repeat protein
MSMFEFSTESNKLRKKLAIHKGAVRSIEFDGSGKFLVSGSKDKSFKVTDVVSVGVGVRESFQIQSYLHCIYINNV